MKDLIKTIVDYIMTIITRFRMRAAKPKNNPYRWDTKRMIQERERINRALRDDE